MSALEPNNTTHPANLEDNKSDSCSVGKCACSAVTQGDIFGKDNGITSRRSINLNPKQKREATVLGINLLIFFIAMIADEYFSEYLGTWGLRALFAIPYIICGLPVFRDGIASLRLGNWANEFMLMAVATIAAVILGHMPEAVGVMLFYRIGEFFQDLATSRSRGSIKALLASKPSTANILEDENVTQVDVEKVLPGQTILVRVGEKIPLDGKVIYGNSEVDQSPLTGESMPVRVQQNSEVLAGSINLSSVLTVLVTSCFADTHMARIMEMVEGALARKSPTERFILKFARYYTPIVVIVAALAAILPPLLSEALWSTWIYRSLVLLVISCPCALLISIPLGYFGGIGAASRRGILVKGGNVLDGLLNTKTVIFDKTGTLTHGVFEVSSLAPASGVSQVELLQAAAIAESDSNHPIARAILKYCPDFSRPRDLSTREIPGKGMFVESAGSRYLAGNSILLQDNSIQTGEDSPEGTVVHVAKDSAYLGSILVSDRIKEGSAAAISVLKESGFKTWMLTGDRESSAAWVAGATGLDGYRSGLLPEDKVTVMQEIANPEEVIFVGDGINDTPGLALAKVGIAMGRIGSEAAIETADAVILNDNPESVATLFKIAWQVRRVVWQNIFLSLGVKTTFMALGAVGMSGLWEAVFADVGVALLAVLNSARGTRG